MQIMTYASFLTGLHSCEYIQTIRIYITFEVQTDIFEYAHFLSITYVPRVKDTNLFTPLSMSKWTPRKVYISFKSL